MRLKSRVTHAFIEIKVDEIETTVFKSDKKDVEGMIDNLLDVVNDLQRFTDKPNLFSKAPEMLEMLRDCYDRLYLLGIQNGDINSEPLIKLLEQLIKEAIEL
jgi:hypothetical protein